MPLNAKQTKDALALSELKSLRPEDVLAIERALAEVGSFGEVHLVVENGQLRFLRTLRSEAIPPPNSRNDRNKI